MMARSHTPDRRDASRGLVRYLIGFASAALLTASPFAASALFLHNAGETLSPAAAVNRTIETDGLYGTAVNANTPDVKLALVAETKPDVVALGSSRSLQFRRFFFRSSFANAGRGDGRVGGRPAVSRADAPVSPAEATDPAVGSLVVLDPSGPAPDPAHGQARTRRRT
jgi:hypothetical protein